MQILDKPKIQLPSDVDKRCIELCNMLNRLPCTKTYESCEGHGDTPYWIFFKCYSIEVLSRLGRVINPNYSDGNWEIVLDSTDTHPKGCFWLRTTTILDNVVLDYSIDQLIKHIVYWFNDKYDKYFDDDPIVNIYKEDIINE